ncbi:spore cortex biosynthesis protein YabQ [Clostridium chromiireducens]|uniref:Spore cortex biosynthesis protein YabQ n=1 Tax=Clostridium chromiireducens TaxID=225345 RepID=A0A1V4IYY3_9CLOT|nr:spore cortex biosynthesis protein YabQ [Clostridium chromiireducens]MVX65421.1 spore cortex biosynthesis protein YabQ [Clostridium chromiireducens]OPJ64985.1 spore cortex protein YabQ [Clostridium chromiireducens]RII32042.1 spore cortex biosynthesis protein YabQ [Clostridium chromiireducens]
MPLGLNMQINLVIYSLIGGVITGVLFDIYRAIRGLNSMKILTIIEDLLFCILIALIVFTFLLYTNYAFLTPYVYIFITIAILLYFRFFSKYFYTGEIIIGKSFYRFIRIILKNTLYPLKIIIYKITDRRK